jgi:hypothetical protein
MNSGRRFVWGIEPNADPVPIFLAHLGKESMMMLDVILQYCFESFAGLGCYMFCTR